MKRYYFILASMSSGVCGGSVHQELRNILNHIGNSNYDQDPLISLIDVGINRQKVIEYSPWTIHRDIYQNLDSLITSWSSAKSPIKSFNQKSLADVIHSLSDEFPTIGTYLSDLVWLITKDENIPIIDEQREVFGAVMRLRVWHKTFVTFCCGPHVFVSHQLTEWIKRVPGQIVSGRMVAFSEMFPAGVRWRGALQLNDRQNGASQLLDGFQLLCHHKNRQSTIMEEDQAEVVFDGAMSIVAESTLSAVPPHAISPARYSLVLPPIASSSLLENSWKFLSVANSKKNHCYVLRLPLFEEDGAGGDDGSEWSGERWRRKIATGNFSTSETKLNGDWTDHRHFLLIGDGLFTAYAATLYEMRDPTCLDPRACAALVAGDTAVASDNLGTDHCRDLLDGWPRLSAWDVESLEGAVVEAQAWTHERYLGVNKSPKESQLRKLGEEVGSLILTQWQVESGLRRLESEMPATTLADHQTEVPLPKDQWSKEAHGDVEDPELWPERLFLRSLQPHADRDRLDGTMMRQCGPPPLSTVPGRASLLDAADIRRIFAADTKWELHLRDSNKRYCSSSAPSTTVLTSWPAARHCTFHDIYYNRDAGSELKQLEGDQLHGRHVGFLDTVSLASVAALSAELSERALQRPLTDVATPPPATPPTFKKGGHSAPSAGKMRDWLRHGVDQPPPDVRRSPRRKKVSQPPLTAASRALTAVHLQKLRGAVLDALEANRVGVRHPLFRDCAKKLFEISRSYAKDVLAEGSTTRRFREIADSQVKQVIAFVEQRLQRVQQSSRRATANATAKAK